MKSMKNMNAVQRPRQQGFTLIELMIVIAIVGILAAIALPAYQDYTIRARMSEPLAIAAEAKTTMSEFYASNGRMPANAASLGLAQLPRNSYAASVTYRYADPAITFKIQLGTKQELGGMGGGFVVLKGRTDQITGTISWTCGPNDISKVKYLPASCRATASPG